MGDNRQPHRRRSIRLKGYDYARPGAYFVTVCTYRWRYTLGSVIDGKVVLNPCGKIVEATWLKIADIRRHLSMDEYVVMPNHVHGIIMIHTRPENVGATHWVAPTNESDRPHGPAPNSLGAIIGQFKAAASKRINARRGTPGQPVWQRNYYEHIVRNDPSLNRVREYIHYNPRRWRLDRYNLNATGHGEFDRRLEGSDEHDLRP